MKRLVSFALLLIASRVVAQNIATKDLVDGLNNPARWLTYSGDYTGRRHSPLIQVTPENVGRLTAQWIFQTNGSGKFEATPIVIDGYCGPQTIGFIEFFQNDMLQRGTVIAVTGLVAPRGMPGENTLSVMNDMLRRSKLSWYLPDAVGFPRELKNYFYY